MKEGKQVAAVAYPRNLKAKASITDITAEVENDQRESVMKLAEAHEMLAKMIHSALYKDLQLSQKSTRWVAKMLYEEMKKGKSESV
jgi:predicted Zn-dependent protease